MDALFRITHSEGAHSIGTASADIPALGTRHVLQVDGTPQCVVRCIPGQIIKKDAEVLNESAWCMAIVAAAIFGHSVHIQGQPYGGVGKVQANPH